MFPTDVPAYDGGMAQSFSQLFRDLVPRYFDEAWSREDGWSREELDVALNEAGLDTVPEALAELYLAVGAVEDLMEAYYFVWDPDELEVQDGFLLFMEDEDETYSWGLPADSLDVPDPLVHRRDARGNWMSTEATLSEYLLDYYAWVFEEIAPAVESAQEEDDEGRG